MEVNKITVVNSNENEWTPLDLTGDTATEDKVLQGYIFHKADGSQATGTATLSTVVSPDYVSFREYSGERIDLSWLDTSNISIMENMFQNCGRLASLDITHFNLSNVTSMQQMFFGCGSLETLLFPNFDATHGVAMGEMFRGCTHLREIDLSGVITADGGNLYGMFSFCTSAEMIDIRNFIISSNCVVNLMFINVPSTCSIYVNQAAYDFLVDNYNNGGNTVMLEDLSMLHVAS